jgi:hypothetical protein
MDDFDRKINAPFAALRRRGFVFVRTDGRTFEFKDAAGVTHKVPVTTTYGVFSGNLIDYINAL